MKIKKPIDFIKAMLSPVPYQLFIWKADYRDGSYLTEFENNQKEHPFSEIKKDKLKLFSLIGNGSYITFDCQDATFWVGKTYVHKLVIVDENGKEIMPTYNHDTDDYKYTDIIQYKQGAYDFSPNPVGGKAHQTAFSVIGHYIGYKSNVKIDDEQTIYQSTIMQIPITSTNNMITFKFTITSTGKPFKGKLVHKVISYNDYMNKNFRYTFNNTIDLDIPTNLNQEYILNLT